MIDVIFCRWPTVVTAVGLVTYSLGRAIKFYRGDKFTARQSWASLPDWFIRAAFIILSVDLYDRCVELGLLWWLFIVLWFMHVIPVTIFGQDRVNFALAPLFDRPCPDTCEDIILCHIENNIRHRGRGG